MTETRTEVKLRSGDTRFKTTSSRQAQLLARSSWQGDRHQLLAGTPEEALRRIEESKARLLILDASGEVPEHVRLVARAMEKAPLRWRRTDPIPAFWDLIEIYRLAKPPQAVLSKDR